VAVLKVEKSSLDKRTLQFGDIIIEKSGGSSTQAVGRVVFFELKNTDNYSYSNFTARIRIKDKNFNSYFLFLYLNHFYELGYTFSFQSGTSGIKNLNLNDYLNIKIPLPPPEVQQQIVKECKVVDTLVEKARHDVDMAVKAMNTLVVEIKDSYISSKLGDICDLKAGKFVSADNIYIERGKSLYPCYGGNGLRGYTKTFTHDGVYSLIGRQGALCGNVHWVSGLFHATEHAIVVHIIKSDIDAKWFFYMLNNMKLNQFATGVAQPGLSVVNLKPININIPPLSKQKEIVVFCEKQEKIIAISQGIINTAKDKKAEIVRKYL
jgi:restriction endonuclease S subunit